MTFLPGDEVDLVPLDPEDEAHVAAYRRSRNEPTMRATGSYGRGLTDGHASARVQELQSGDEDHALCAIRAENETVGWGTIHTVDGRSRTTAVAYYVLPEHQGNGYASEAARLLVAYAFDELNAHRVEATVQGDNPASKHVLEKLGFVHEGTKRDAYYKEGEYKDLTLWAVFDDGFVRETFDK
ncbi:GNAT family N-acetyltransferase [Halococcus hamelinensis]|uniref:Acetyltransferase n=1 Tax=Halococcus hamelinensis 100A6 TaxID=1132509 RepID=M0LXU1_9EURY|nr:GNAT family N-acetyltransferase [Halococcus hamelinensis]EMA38407.1 acetyltransferase [Halococcus hamelinensis 100A6]